MSDPYQSLERIRERIEHTPEDIFGDDREGDRGRSRDAPAVTPAYSLATTTSNTIVAPFPLSSVSVHKSDAPGSIRTFAVGS